METKKRRTKKKNQWSDSDSDDNSDTENKSHGIKILKNISFVRREKEKEMKKTKKVLDNICDSEDDNDSKPHRLLKRSLSSRTVSQAENTLKQKNNSNDSTSDSDYHTKKNPQSKNKTKKIVDNSKQINTSSSQSDFENGRANNSISKDKISSSKTKSITSSLKSSSDSDASDKNLSKNGKSKSVKEIKHRTDCNEDSIYNDYTILETPTFSGGESIPVDKKREITLKHHIFKEFNKIENITVELKETLEYNSEYVISKKVNVVGDSQFLAHKILRIYDSTFKKLKKSRSEFQKKYKEWINNCNKISKNNLSNKLPLKNRFKISSEDSSDHEECTTKSESMASKKTKKKKNKSELKELTNTSESDSLNEVDTKKKTDPNISNISSDGMSKNYNSDKLQIRKKSDEELRKNTNKGSDKKSSINNDLDTSSETSKKKSDKDSTPNEDTSILNPDQLEEEKLNKSRKESNPLITDDESLSDPQIEITSNKEKEVIKRKNSASKNLKNKNLDQSTSEKENDSGVEKSKSKEPSEKNNSKEKVSECDSDEIFSGDESRPKKLHKKKSDELKINELMKKSIENNQNSEEMFDSTISEIPNTPVKSPILSRKKKSFCKTLHSTEKNISLDPEDKINANPTNEENPLEISVEAFIEKNQNADVNPIEEQKVEKAVEKNIEVEETENINDISELEHCYKLLQDSDNSSKASSVIITDSESTKEDDNSDIDVDLKDKSKDAQLENKISSSSAESRAKAKKFTKKTNDQSLKSKTRIISSDSSSEENQRRSRAKRDAKKKRNLSLKSSDSDDSLRPATKHQCRRNSFNIRNSRFKHDVKLLMRCVVSLERLPERILVKYSRALAESRDYLANKKFHSITNLDNLESRKKSKKRSNKAKDSENDMSSKSKKKSKKEKKSKKNQLDEESDVDSCDDVSNNVDADSCNYISEQDIMEEAENEAMEALLNNSESDNENEEMEISNGNNELKIKIARVNNKKISNSVESVEKSDNEDENVENEDEDVENEEDDDAENEEVEDVVNEEDEDIVNEEDEDIANEEDEDLENKEDEDVENEEENEGMEPEDDERKKNKWKNDSLLNFHITDTESDEAKSNKSLEKRKAKKEQEKNNKSQDDDCQVVESPVKEKVSKRGRKQRKTRRILDSESDAKMGTSDEENEEKNEEEMSDDDYEIENDKEKVKKKKGKKRRQKSSDSETSSSEKKSKSKRKRIKKTASDDSDTDKDSPGKGRKNIRKVLRDKHVADDTKKAAQDEEERLKRIAERQRLFNEMYDAKLAGEAKVEKLVLDIDEETKKELVVVNPELVKRLKPHQAQGIKFMWDACYESLKQIEKSEGSGCIIAHCMGLGKTFQVVTLVHTLLTHEETGVRTVMIVCPLSTVLNWVNEFKMWLKHTKDGDEIEIYELTKLKKNVERKCELEQWQRTGGVLMIGYEMFRNLTSTGRKMRKAMQESVTRSLVDPGADLVVCDEGHLLKNEDSALSKAMKLVKTLRRIVLTGTPLQNNLKEYHCMVQFVKPNLLGTKKEFLNRFVNPITNGQFDDSTPYDVKIMKKRAHVLHKMLEGSVQRFDYSVLTPFLPPKQEYVIFIRLTEVQINMYRHYLDNFARKLSGRNGSLFADFQALQRIWTHPYVLRLNAEKIDKINEKKRLEASDSEGSLKDFIDDDDSESEVSIASSSPDGGSGSDVQCLDSDNEKRPVKMTRAARMNMKEELRDEVPIAPATHEETAWWSKFVEEKHFEDMRISTKLLLLFGILKESEQIGDKVLVFSQSLYSLTLIEHFLNLIDQETQNDGENAEFLDAHSGRWALGQDYFRLDGSHSAESRSSWCKTFNNPKNTQARLFLISTRAGGLGINLTAANRVIIFDASWNPSHDVQSIFRVYRFGQKKPCYIYRFLAAGTMEEKIYNRQVTKLSLACRVVDEQQIERHYSNNDLAELYQFESYEDKHPTLGLPKDRMLAEIFLKYKDYVYNYHEHDSLLENKEEEELDEEERKQAWLEYEEEKQGKRQILNMGMNNTMGGLNLNQIMMNMANSPDFEYMKQSLQKDFPNLPPEHMEVITRQAMFDLYRQYLDNPGMNMGMSPYGDLGPIPGIYPQMPVMTQQQHTINQQNQLMNLLNQPAQMNYQGHVNHMPAYSGRGRPPKSLTNSMYNPMRQMPMQAPIQMPMQASMQIPMNLQQAHMQAQQNNVDDIEVLAEKVVNLPDNTSNMNNKPEE